MSRGIFYVKAGKKRNIILIIAALLIVVGAVWVVRQIYLYNNIDNEFYYFEVESTDRNLQLVSYSSTGYSVFGYSHKLHERENEVGKVLSDMMTLLCDDTVYTSPINVTSSVKIEDGHTIINHNGTATTLAGEK